MRKTLLILFVASAALASATIKDLRQHVKLSPELSQAEVARQQSLQREQGQVGTVPEKTDGSGYIPQSQSDPDAAKLIALHNPTGSSNAANQVLSKNDQAMKNEADKPKKTAFGILWALLLGALLAFAAWAGLQKYGPKPPAHLK